jgi:hypothetical protein
MAEVDKKSSMCNFTTRGGFLGDPAGAYHRLKLINLGALSHLNLGAGVRG